MPEAGFVPGRRVAVNDAFLHRLINDRDGIQIHFLKPRRRLPLDARKLLRFDQREVFSRWFSQGSAKFF